MEERLARVQECLCYALCLTDDIADRLACESEPLSREEQGQGANHAMILRDYLRQADELLNVIELEGVKA